MPAAPSRWPTLVFAEPTSSGLPPAGAAPSDRTERGGLDRVADPGAGAVQLDVLDLGRVHPGLPVRLRAARRSWPSLVGVVRLSPPPSLLTALPRITQ